MMRVFLAIICLLHASAKPLADKNLCPINEVYRCGTEPCPCENDNSEPVVWKKFLSSIFHKISNRCECKKLCKRVVNAPCKRGMCDRENGRCHCFPCWTGISCSVYENRHGPVFAQTYTEMKIAESLNKSKVIGKVAATDADQTSCMAGLKCPCAEIHYQLLDGADDTFRIHETSGEIVMSWAPYKDDYVLEIGATNIEFSQSGYPVVTVPDVKKRSKMYVHVDTRDYQGERLKIAHSRQRRSVSTGSLLLTIVPSLNGKYYYDIGDNINFILNLKHNLSAVMTSVSDVAIRVSSDYLSLTTDGIKLTNNGTFTSSSNMTGDIMSLSLSSASFASGDSFTANFTATVKNTIQPLSNLLVTAELNATTDVYMKQSSNPVLYAVYPKVNLTKSSDSAVSVYGSKDFNMKITLPKLNYTLLAELTTNIENYIFMEIESVTVTKTGSAVTYLGSAVPQYFSTLNDGIKDRVVIDFGYVKNNLDVENTVEIAFKVKVYDHALLTNNSLHWVGVGLQAGMRVLWVEQQAFRIIKEEPTLSVSVTSPNITTNSTRLYIGDRLALTYTVNHTNTSTAKAMKVQITCNFDNFVVPTSELASSLSPINTTSAIVKHNSSSQNTLLLGESLTGTFYLQLSANVTPFIAATVKLTVEYENAVLTRKKPVTTSLAQSVLAGTPNILMSLNASNNKMMPGEKRSFTVTVLLTKMKCPIIFELVMPMVLNSSVFHILSVDKAIIGSHIQGLNANAQPILKSSKNDGMNNLAIYDLGTATNTNQDTSSSDNNKIKLTFEVMLVDHQNVTNGSTFWVGAGLVGKPNMIWVGQIIMTSIVPIDSRPRLSMTTAILEMQSSYTYPDYRYSMLLKHHASSTQSAYNVKIRFFLPEYVKYLLISWGSIPRVTQKKYGGSRLFEISGRFFFTDSFNITFKVRIDETKLPQHTGKVYITTPIYLLYTNLNGQQFTLVKALKKFIDVPEKQIPTVTPVPEYYAKGFSWHKTGTSSYSLFICSDTKAQKFISACYYTNDKGATWHPVDSRVASVIGHSSEGGTRYGISSDKLSYLKFDTDVKRWVSIPKASFNPAANTVVKLGSSHTSGDPSSSQTVISDHWGVSADGVYYKAGGVGSWVKKSIWL